MGPSKLLFSLIKIIAYIKMIDALSLAIFIIFITILPNTLICESADLPKEFLSDIIVQNVELSWLVEGKNGYEMKLIFNSGSKDICENMSKALKDIKRLVGDNHAIGLLPSGLIVITDSKGLKHKIGVTQIGYSYNCKSALSNYFSSNKLNKLVLEMIHPLSSIKELYMPEELRLFLTK